MKFDTFWCLGYGFWKNALRVPPHGLEIRACDNRTSHRPHTFVVPLAPTSTPDPKSAAAGEPRE